MSFYTNSCCSICGPRNLGHGEGLRWRWFCWGHQKRLWSMLGQWLGSCTPLRNGMGCHRFPMGQLAHLLIVHQRPFQYSSPFLFIFPLPLVLFSSHPLLPSFLFLGSFQAPCNCKDSWDLEHLMEPAFFSPGSITVKSLKAFSFKDKLENRFEECWEVMPASSFFSFPLLGLKDRIFFFFTVHFGRSHFFLTEKK